MFKKINDQYTNKEIILSMQNFFEEENFIQLTDFFNDNIAKNNLSILKTQKFIEKYNPIKYRFKKSDITNIYNLDLIKLIEFFRSNDFLDYIENITQLELNFKDIQIKKYSKKDFTLLHDELKCEDTIEVIYDLTKNWQDEFGGVLTYTSKEEEIFYLDPKFNALTILYKSSSLMQYLKYINNLSENKIIYRIEIKFTIE